MTVLVPNPTEDSALYTGAAPAGKRRLTGLGFHLYSLDLMTPVAPNSWAYCALIWATSLEYGARASKLMGMGRLAMKCSRLINEEGGRVE